MIRLVLAAISAVSIIGASHAQTSAPPVAKPKASKAAAPAPDPFVTEARGAVSRSLKDPGSAQFQNVRARSVTNLRGEPMQVVCGEVNAKNSLGGYTGFAPFIYDDKTRGARVLGPDQDIATVAMLKNFCN